MQISKKILGTMCVILALIAIPSVVSAAAPCNQPDNIGGGVPVGTSPGPVGPPDSLGWDVGAGQCNGSFTSTTNVFPGGAIELAMRAEERSVGQVARVGANEYVVQTGPDPTNPARAWWNFQQSIAYSDIEALDSLTFTIQTISGPNLPDAPAFDLLALRGLIDDRNNQPNPTLLYGDLYQTSQNPVFGWFDATSDNDANPNDNFDYDEEGAWVLTITAVDGMSTASVSICIHTPGASCPPAQVPASSPWGMVLLGIGLVVALGILTTRLWVRPHLV